MNVRKGAVAFLSLLVVSLVATGIYAQERQGRGAGGGGFMGRIFQAYSSNIISDVLVLNAESAEKLDKALTPVIEKAVADLQSQDPQGGDARERFAQIREDAQSKVLAVLKETLSEDEVKKYEPLMGARAVVPTPQIRALRMIELKEGQQTKLQDAVIAYYTGLNDAAPAFGRGQGGNNEDARAEYEKKREELFGKLQGSVTESLDDEQETAWKAKSDELAESMAEEMRGMRRGGGGGQRGQ